MKKTLYTLCVNNYAPEITELTFPLFKRYAHKIDADFCVIDERRWPDMPPVYEKLQIYDLARENGSDWNIYIDADALLHPDLFDVTEIIPMNTVMHNGNDMAGNRWRYDEYFRRDGRHIGSCNWFTVASYMCLDIWHPLDDITFEQALENIHPIQSELQTIIEPGHLIDDYILSRNIARYGLKFTTLIDELARIGDKGNYLWHQYTITIEEKVRFMTGILKDWNIV